MAKAAKRLFICLDNAGYEVSLERRKIYVTLPDTKAERTGYLRIIDESGEAIYIHRSASSQQSYLFRPVARFCTPPDNSPGLIDNPLRAPSLPSGADRDPKPRGAGCHGGRRHDPARARKLCVGRGI